MIRRLEVSSTPPITLASAKAALRVTHSFEDAVVERKLRAAVSHFEFRTNRFMRVSDLELALTDWPVYPDRDCFDGIRLIAAPVREVESIEYRNDAGGWVEIAAENWTWDRRDYGAEITFRSAYALPSLTSEFRDVVRVRFVAGYEPEGQVTGVDPELVLPDEYAEAVLMLAGHWLEHREAVTDGETAEVPLALNMVLQSARIFA